MRSIAHPVALGAKIRVLLGAVILLSIPLLGPSSGARAQTGDQLTVPPVPDPVAVSLDPSTTALIVADVNSAACPDQPPCAVTEPIAALLARSRAANAMVVFSTYSPSVLPPPANGPQPGEIVLVRPSDGPAWLGMDGVLRSRNIQTVVLTGNSLQQLILNGSYELIRYGYTIVVPEDGTVGASPYVTAAVRYQLLNGAGERGNPDNVPLKRAAITLSRSDLITFE